MADLATPPPVKLIVGMLSLRPAWLELAAERLQGLYGRIDIAGPILDFTFTRYYERQMGGPLLRQFVAFERLIDPGDIARIKRQTNDIEEQLAAQLRAGEAPVLPNTGETPVLPAMGETVMPPRPVNLDPGYVAEGKLVLASTKDFSHRIYLGGGIFAEVTLMYGQGRWIAQKYTFPDYASRAYDAFLNEAREALRRELGRAGGGGVKA